MLYKMLARLPKIDSEKVQTAHVQAAIMKCGQTFDTL